jgi:hypothetical protein
MTAETAMLLFGVACLALSAGFAWGAMWATGSRPR